MKLLKGLNSFLKVLMILSAAILIATWFPRTINTDFRTAYALVWALTALWPLLFLWGLYKGTRATRTALDRLQNEWLQTLSERIVSILIPWLLNNLDHLTLDLDERRAMAHTIWQEWEPEVTAAAAEWRSGAAWTLWVPPGLTVYVDHMLSDGLEKKIEPWLAQSLGSVIATLPPADRIELAGSSLLADTIRNSARTYITENYGDLVRSAVLGKKLIAGGLWSLLLLPWVLWLLISLAHVWLR